MHTANLGTWASALHWVLQLRGAGLGAYEDAVGDVSKDEEPSFMIVVEKASSDKLSAVTPNQTLRSWSHRSRTTLELSAL